MNRLVLIGNGFDLAHNLKTGYKDFLHWYLQNVLNEFFSKRNYNDKLLSLRSNSTFNGLPEMDTLEQVIEVINNLKARNDGNLSIKFLSPFFKEILEVFTHKNWVDLENHYFSYLTRSVKNSDLDVSQIISLNEQFEYLKIKLEEYLSLVCTNMPAQNPSKFHYLLNDVEGCQLMDAKPINQSAIEKIYVVNFNYTNTFNKYADFLNSKVPTQINHIHGELNNALNPIIFGYGDEHNEEYKSFENKKFNELFKHIKSFKYLRTSNYQNLIRFINSNEFQVCIMGHSCGLTDRTMLKEIFEHDNCMSIMIYYHKWGQSANENDYVNKTYEISRHFTNKGLMRKRVVSFENSEPLY